MAYHHGNARTALLAAAADLIEREGAARFSLRQVAERAGLSRQAPYNHFVDKEALLAELAADGFRQMGADIAAIDARDAPSRRLASAAERYIAFGQQRPALFRLMFSKELVDTAKYPEAQAAGAAVLAQLSSIIAALGPTADVAEASLVAWSLVHGYTSLCIEAGLEDASHRQARADLFAQTVEALVLL